MMIVQAFLYDTEHDISVVRGLRNHDFLFLEIMIFYF